MPNSLEEFCTIARHTGQRRHLAVINDSGIEVCVSRWGRKGVKRFLRFLIIILGYEAAIFSSHPLQSHPKSMTPTDCHIASNALLLEGFAADGIYRKIDLFSRQWFPPLFLAAK